MGDELLPNELSDKISGFFTSRVTVRNAKGDNDQQLVDFVFAYADKMQYHPADNKRWNNGNILPWKKVYARISLVEEQGVYRCELSRKPLLGASRSLSFDYSVRS